MPESPSKSRAGKRRKVPRAERLEQVLRQARALFETEGFAGTSMQAVSDAVGISKPVLYDLVGSKEELFNAVIRQEAAELRRRILQASEPGSDPLKMLRLGLSAFFNFVGERKAAWLQIFEYADSLGASALEKVRREQDELVASLIRQALKGEGVELDAGMALVMARALNGAAEALATWWVKKGGYSAEDLADLMVGFIQPNVALLKGLKKRGVSRN